jgi:hypothetical protein
LLAGATSNLSLYHDNTVQEEDDPSAGRIGRAVEELEEIGDPELEAMGQRILERPAGWKIGLALVVVLVIVGGAVFGWVMRSQISRLPRLDEGQAKALAEHVRAAAELPAHRRRATVGRAMAQIEQERIPGPLLRAMVDGGRQTEHTRLLALRHALEHAEVRPLWQELCPADFDIEALGEGQESGARVYQLCGLHRFELLSASHVITSHAGEVLAAHAIFHHLQQHDALTDVEIEALRAFARGTVAASRAIPFE